jgi:hypothetical protein
VRQFVKNPSATGNVTNPTAPSPNASLSARILTVSPRSNAVLVTMEELESLVLYHSSKKLKITKNAVHAIRIKISL